MDDVLSVDVRSKKFANTEGSYFFLKDDLGSIVDITDSNGTVVQHYTYSAFGRILGIKDGIGNDITGSPLITSHFTYTGREFDSETGLYYYRARYYDPNTGRFLTKDPHPGLALNPLTINSKYNYVLNNPINDSDPSGKLGPLAIIGIAMLAGAIVNGTVYLLTMKKFEWKSFGKALAVGALAGGLGAAASFAAPGLGGAMLGGFVGGSSGSLLNSWFSGEDPFSEKNLFKAAIAGSIGLVTAGFGYHISAAMVGMQHAAYRELAVGTSAGIAGASVSTPTDWIIDTVDKLIPKLP